MKGPYEPDEYDYEQISVRLTVPEGVIDTYDAEDWWDEFSQKQRANSYLNDTIDRFEFEHSNVLSNGTSNLEWVILRVKNIDIQSLLEKEYVTSIWADQSKYELVEGEAVQVK